ncbi:histidine phosphatase family protein [Acinetobacter junii]|uniref:histidine phosphatase family protein n=1 Tax=Acinetobacter junii TaxID=40215 RepID=UPI00100F0A53|nr:histidine phosphatase family protein [Acinetobacter junii]RXS99525.1 histidine phosphatase family protein [Acinetobacter junii]
MSIFLIRHAESIANINHRSDCHASIELSESGKQQAQRLCEELPAIDHIIISKYLRTYQTAEPILQKYELEAEIDPNIHEFSYLSERKCANTNLDERKEWVRAYWEKMDCYYRDAEDAESFADLYTRVQQFYQQINCSTNQYVERNLVVFSHGQFLQLLITLIKQPQSLSKSLMQNFRSDLIHNPIKNTEIFIFRT